MQTKDRTHFGSLKYTFQIRKPKFEKSLKQNLTLFSIAIYGRNVEELAHHQSINMYFIFDYNDTVLCCIRKLLVTLIAH